MYLYLYIYAPIKYFHCLSDTTMNYDGFLITVGEFGKLQKIQFCIVAVVAVLAACHSLSVVFITAIPNHHCHLPHNTDILENNSYSGLKTYNHVLSKVNHIQASSCHMVNSSYANNANITEDGHEQIYEKQNCLYGYDYDQDVYLSTIVSEVSRQLFI